MINVLIVGETQQGKSTLIKQLSKYAGTPGLNIGIGDGNASCTKTVGLYEISAVLMEYILVDMNGNSMSDLSYIELCDLTPKQAKVVPVQESQNGAEVLFTMIDTPGLSDSDGDDLDAMASIVGRVGELDHINALVYVRSIGSAFGQSFKDFFSYLQRSMPSLCNGLMVVHSNFTSYKVEEFLDDNKNLAELRRQAFKAATNLELAHFFMDNEPSPSSPFAVCQSLNAVFRLLSHITAQKAFLTEGLKLLKTPKMKDLDVHVTNVLSDLKLRLESSWSQQKSHAKVLDQIAIGIQRDIAKTKRKLQMNEDHLRTLQTSPDVVLGTQNAVDDYSFLSHLLLKGQVNLGRKVMSFDSDFKITSVQKTCSGGSQWLDEELRGTSWRAIITAGWFRDIQGSATFYTTSAIRYAEEIRLLKASINELEERLNDLNESLAQSGGSPNSKRELAELSEKVEQVDDLLQMVKGEVFDIALWSKVRMFYSSQGRPSTHEIRGLIDIYNPRLARLISV